MEDEGSPPQDKNVKEKEIADLVNGTDGDNE